MARDVYFDDDCLTCNLRCSVTNPKVKNGCAIDNCPKEEAKNAKISIDERMPLLAFFNLVLESFGMEKIGWKDG